MVMGRDIVMLTRPALLRPRPRSRSRSRPNTLKVNAKAMISRPRPLEEKVNNKAKNNHVEITIVAVMHGN